jgi:four helix bundle protein
MQVMRVMRVMRVTRVMRVRQVMSECVAESAIPSLPLCSKVLNTTASRTAILTGIPELSRGPAIASVAGMKDVCRLEDLVAWQLAVQLRQLVHRYCEKPAIRRDFKYHDNLADAASSAPRNIAEGWARKYHPEFARFSIIARGSEQEVLNCLHEGYERKYLDAHELDAGDHAARKALKVLNRLIDYLESTPDWGRD